jgi:hypothetical protein
MMLLGFTFDIPPAVFVLVPALLLSLSLYLVRWVRRQSITIRAEHWPSAEAVVNSSYELDENETVLSVENWERAEHKEQEYEPLWCTAIQYTYHANGEIYAGTYFLPTTSSDGHIAAESGRSWLEKRIVVRYNPHRPEQSAFLVQDGAPGKSYIPRLVADRPQFTSLSLK